MPNNFRLVGNYYVSKAGNDSNDGLTPDTPKRTIQAALTLSAGGSDAIIVGPGVYRETLSKNFSGGVSCSIYADGIVVLESPSVNGSISLSTSVNGRTIAFYNFVFRNYSSITLSHAANGNFGFSFFGCRFINTVISSIASGYSSVITASYCIFIKTTFTVASGVGSSNLTYNIFISSYCNSISSTTFVNNYADSSSILAFVGTVNYNNIQCPILIYTPSTVTTGVIQDIYGRYYDLSIATSTGDGTIGNPYGRPYTNGAGFGFSAHRTAYPTLNPSSSAVDPGFNNILKQDFSLQSSSFMVGRASDFVSNIGGTYVATRLNASGSTFSGSNATTDNFVFNSGDYVISGSAVTGSVTSAPIFVSSSAKVIQEIDYNGLLAFNKDTTAPTGSNVNVPDVLTYTSASGQPGANPDRLTYYMRWTTGSSQPVSDAQWENGGLWPAGSFNVFEWNTKPAVDFLGRGNGDQNFNIVNTPTFVKATWIQLRVSLRNDYLI